MISKTCLRAILCVMLLPHLSSAVANADEGVYRDAVLRMTTSFHRPDSSLSYCRTCCHRTNGFFAVTVISKPKLSAEWCFVDERPSFKWTVSPNFKGKISGLETQRLSVVLANSDFPSSFTVTAKVKWRIKKQGNFWFAAGRDVEYEVAMQFDAIGYEIKAESCANTDGLGDGSLVDSDPGLCRIEAHSCRRPDL